MTYEVIKEILNECANNQMRDVFFEEYFIEDPDAWVRAQDPEAETIQREDIPGGIRYRVWASGLPIVYSLTEID